MLGNTTVVLERKTSDVEEVHMIFYYLIVITAPRPRRKRDTPCICCAGDRARRWILLCNPGGDADRDSTRVCALLRSYTTTIQLRASQCYLIAVYGHAINNKRRNQPCCSSSPQPHTLLYFVLFSLCSRTRSFPCARVQGRARPRRWCQGLAP